MMNRTGDKGQPCRSPTCSGNKNDLLPEIQTKLLLRSCRDWAALSIRPRMPYSQSTPHRTIRGTQSNAFSKSIKQLVGQTPMHPPAPWEGYRSSPVFHDLDKNCTVPPDSEVLLTAEFSSPVPWHRFSRGGWGMWSPCSGNTPSGPPS